MLGLIYLAIALAAIGFAIVAVYLSFVMYRLSRTMKIMGTSIVKAEETANDMLPKLNDSLRETGLLLDDAQVKLDAVDSLFDTAQNVGGSVHNLAEAYQGQSGKMTEEELKKSFIPFAELLNWSEVAIEMFKKTK